jgi:branched-chain amino acid aminotransferase
VSGSQSSIVNLKSYFVLPISYLIQGPPNKFGATNRTSKISYLLNLNGHILSEKKSPPYRNRAFRYGDGLFETMRLSGERIPLWERHWKRLTEGLRLIGISEERLGGSQTMLSEALKTAEGMEHARIRLTVYRQGEGAYYSLRNDTAFVIEASETSPPEFRESGLEAGFFRGLRLPHDPRGNPFWNLKSCNALPYILAANDAKANQWDEALLFNASGYLSEGSHTNLFVWKKGELITPPLSSGCVAGVMRALTMEIAGEKEIPLILRNLLPDELGHADEIWLVNALQGVQYIHQLEESTYSGDLAREFMEVIKNYFLWEKN